MSTTLTLTDVNLIAERMDALAARFAREAATLTSDVRRGENSRPRQLAALLLLEKMCDDAWEIHGDFAAIVHGGAS